MAEDPILHGASGATRRHFLALDGLRGVAALAVFVFHRRLLVFTGGLGHGYLGVDFFFVLSGFVIGHAYEARLAGGRLGFGAFVVTRFVRLMPLLALGVAFGTLVAVIDAVAHRWTGGVVRALAWAPLAAVPLPSPILRLPWLLDGPSWSLFFELAANFAYALVAARLTDRRLTIALAVSLVPLVAVTLYANSINFGREWFDFPVGFVRVAFPFLLGIRLHRWHRAGALPRRAVPVWALAAAIVAAFAVPFLPAPWNAAYDLAVTLLLFPAVVAAGSVHEPAGRWVWLVGLSAALSYPVYILHWPMMELIEMAPGVAALPGGARLALLAAIILPFAWGAARWYDEPVRAALRARLAPLMAGRRAPARGGGA